MQIADGLSIPGDNDTSKSEQIDKTF